MYTTFISKFDFFVIYSASKQYGVESGHRSYKLCFF